MRAVSTVVDVTVFLLLVSAAVATLGLPHERPPDSSAPDVATVLGTSTTSVEYRLSVTENATSGIQNGRSRTATGALAELLADAAVSNVTLSGTPLLRAGGQFRSEVTEVVRRVTRRTSDPVRIDARWVVYPNAPLAGHVGVGPAPPPSVDVQAVTLRVPAPIERIGTDARRVADRGYDAVARVVARATVDRLLPPSLAVALEAVGTARQLARARYATVSNALGAVVGEEVRSAATRGANRVFVRALADRLAADMRAEFDTPTAAARAVRVGTVRITVRGWER